MGSGAWRGEAGRRTSYAVSGRLDLVPRAAGRAPKGSDPREVAGVTRCSSSANLDEQTRLQRERP